MLSRHYAFIYKMKKIFQGISGKIYGGFALLIGVFIINTVTIFYFISKNQKDTNYSSQVSQPSLVAVNEFQILVLRSQSYTSTWVKTEIDDNPDKKALPILINKEYPVLKASLLKLSDKWKDENLKQSLKKSIVLYDSVVGIQNDIMKDLKTFDDYSDIFKKVLNETDRGDAVNSKITRLNGKINGIVGQLKNEAASSQESMLASFRIINGLNIFANIVVLIIGIGVSFFIVRSITRPVNGLSNIIARLSKGEQPQIDIKSTKDEIGEMVDNTKDFVSVLQKRTDFAREIGNGNYNNDFELLSDSDILGHALIQMRDNLRNSAEEDRRRNWITIGVAEIGDLLRQHNNNAKALYDNVLKYIVKYLGANQGGIFLLNAQNAYDKHIELVAAFAYERKKFLEKRIEIGEGLVGQCVQEGEQIFLTDVPDDYINITSGMGSANPNCIIIMPLKYNEEILGVIEIASFKVFEQYHIDFIARLAESVASTISMVKVNETTKTLLQDSQIQAETLKSQEEEMRQNLEEMQATQEHQARMERELKESERILQAKVAELEQKLSEK